LLQLEEEKANRIIEDTKQKVKSILKGRAQNEVQQAESAGLRDKQQKIKQNALKKRHQSLHIAMIRNTTRNYPLTRSFENEESP
jgi:hypothetical protein